MNDGDELSIRANVKCEVRGVQYFFSVCLDWDCGKEPFNSLPHCSPTENQATDTVI